MWFLPIKKAVQEEEPDEAVLSEEEVEALIQERKKKGVCVLCGSRGEWIMLGLFCKEHGRIF